MDKTLLLVEDNPDDARPQLRAFECSNIVEAIERARSGSEDPVHCAAELHEAHRAGDSLGPRRLRDPHGVQQRVEGILDRGDGLSRDRERLGEPSRRFEEGRRLYQCIATRLAAQQELSQRLSAERRPEAMVGMFLRAAARILGAGIAAICVLDERGAIVHLIAEGIDARALRARALDRSRWPGALLDCRELQHASANDGPAVPGAARSVLGLSVRTSNRSCGWMYFGDKLGGSEFDADDGRSATAMAAQFALIYENVRLHDLVQHHTARLQSAADETRRRTDELQSSEARLAGLISAAMDAVITVDQRQRIVTFNAAAEQMFGYGAEQVRGGLLDRLIPARWRQAHRDHVQGYGSKATGSRRMGAQYPVLGLRANGEEFPIEASLSRFEAGGESFFTAIVRDVTERKKSEQALRESEQRFRQMAESIHDVFFLVDAGTGEMLYVNPAYERIWRRTRDSLYAQPRSWRDAIHPDDRERVTRLAIAGMQSGQFEDAYRIVRPDGETRWIEARGFPIRDEAGRCYRMAGIATDVTERHKTESDCAQLAAIVEFCDDAIIGTTLDGTITSWNAGAERLYGHAAAEAIGQPTALVVPPDRLDEEQRILAESRRGEHVDRLETLRRRKNGSLLDVSLTISPIRNASGEVIGVAKIARDISQRVRLQNVVREREIALSRAQVMARLGHVLTRADGSFESWSATLPQLFGLDQEHMPRSARAALGLVDPCDRDWLRSRFIEAAAQGTRAELEYRLRRGDGTWIDIRHSIAPIEKADTAGRPPRWFSTLQDVTEQRRAQDALRESERRFSDMLDNVELISMMLDLAGRITYCNDCLLRLTGWAREELMGRNWFEVLLPAGDVARHKSVHVAGLNGEAVPRHHESHILTRGGELRCVRWSNSFLRSPGGDLIGMASIGEDITEHKRAEARLARLNRVYAVLSGINALIIRVENLGELFRESCRIVVDAGAFGLAWIVAIDPTTGEATVAARHGGGSGQVEAFGLPRLPGREHEVGDAHPVHAALLDRAAVICNDIRVDLASSEPLRTGLLDAGYRSMGCFPILVEGNAIAVLSLLDAAAGAFDDDEMRLLSELACDISFAADHLRKAERLHYLSYYDALTGLANGTLMRERLQQYIASAASTGEQVVVGLLDIERFKIINDTLGRHAGDALLRETARRLRDCVGSQNQIARMGADVFAVVMSGVKADADIARIFHQGAQQCFGPSFRVGGRELSASARIGIAVYPIDGSDAEAIFRNAEAALKKTKSGAHAMLFYNAKMTEAIAQRLDREHRLRHALQNDEFVLFYQPKVDFGSRQVIAVEALLRWNSPELGMVPPGAFISVLEETGLIVEVGLWAVRCAALQHKAWIDAGLAAPRIAVNVSAVQLARPDFVAAMEAALGQGADPHGIDIEITESLLMENIEDTIAKLNALRSLAVGIAIDDFGTGYSSLAYLAKLPLQILKIDRSFVSTMVEDPDSQTLVSTMISLAHSLRMEVVAEGVETEEQAGMLHRLRCDQMQGYLVSKPVPALEITQLIRRTGARPAI